MVTSAPEQLIRPGDNVDRYVVLAKLGEGGAAVVFRARHRELGTLHALKVLRVGTGTQSERLMQEGRIQATLKHPNIVGVTDVVRVGSFPALVMEHVAGLSLDRLLLQYRPGADEIDVIARDILEGMRAAHEQGLIHRDLKPANVLLELGRDRAIAKVSDFGLAKLLDEVPEGRHRSTLSGVMMGTPAYMAPEQLRSARDVDHRADIFALGCLLYELVSGVPVFSPEDLKDMISLYQASSGGKLRPLDEVAPDAPRRWVEAVHEALRPAPEDRPQTIEALQERWIQDTKRPEPVWELALLRGLSGVEEASHTVQATGTIIPVEPTTIDPDAQGHSPLAQLGAVRATILVASLLALGAALTLFLSASFGTLAWLTGGNGTVAVMPPLDPAPLEAQQAVEPSEPLQATSLPSIEPVSPVLTVASPVSGPTEVVRGGSKPVEAAARSTAGRPADGPLPDKVAFIAPSIQVPPSVLGSRFEVTGVDKGWLEDVTGRKHRPGAVAPGEYVLHVFFDAARSTRVLTFTLGEGEQRTVRCDPITRICK